MDHLRKHHGIREGIGRSPMLTIRQSFAQSDTRPASPPEDPSESSKSDRIELQRRRTKKALITWMAHNHISFREVETREFQLFCESLNEKFRLYMTTTHTTISRWIYEEYAHQKADVRERVAAAQSRIHLSFDLWTSPFRNFAVLSIVGHFLNKEGKNIAILLGLRRLQGSHSGENMALLVLELLQEYKIDSRFGYFVLDNASSNDTCVKAILRAYNIPSEYELRRLRCFGHIVNLVAQAFLFGQDVKAFEAEEYETMEKAYEIYQKAGPVGIVHFIAVFIRSSSQRREDFARCQGGSEELVPKADNRTRWNSTFYMLQRALALRKAIDLFCLQYVESKELNISFKLDDLAWSRLQSLCDILQYFEYATKALEGSAREGHHGALWECLPTMELLLKQLEQLKLQYPHSNDLRAIPVSNTPTAPRRRNPLPPPPSESLADQFIAIAINNAWLKLDEYYTLTDRSIAYVAAVVLNPAHKWTYFEKHWASKLDWLVEAKASFRAFWEQYRDGHPVPNQQVLADLRSQRPQHLQAHMDSLYHDDSDSDDGKDELLKYLNTKRRKAPKDELYFNPIKWWLDNQGDFPTLSRLALDLLSIPAMAAEDERVFSSTGKLITADRNALDAGSIEAVECLRHWHRAFHRPPSPERKQQPPVEQNNLG